MMAEVIPAAGELAGLGAAGLMGALWIWERRLSRARETELSQAHERLMAERGLMRLVANLIRRNTVALSKLQTTQDQLMRLLSNWPGDDGRPDPPPPQPP